MAKGFTDQPKCDRCGGPTDGQTIMSMFNTQVICRACKTKEAAHRDYWKAVEADEAAIRTGNFNFPGIGLPTDLR